MHSTQIPGNLAEGETVQEFRIPAPKHTPGPWQVVDAGNPEIRSASGQCLADAWCYDLEYTDEAEANARLIAQAPTLLADLTDAAAQVRKYEALHRARQGELSTELADANAALAARFEATIAAAVGGCGMNQHEAEVCDDLDASLFSGDAFYDEVALRELEHYLARWQRRVAEIRKVLSETIPG